MQVLTKSEKETTQLAKKFAGSLNGGEVIGFIGDLGAGKTFFIKALAKALGVKKTVISPTFNLLRVYEARLNKKPIKLVHVDAYRLKNAKELAGIGLQDYLDSENTITAIEWAEKIKPLLPKNTIYIKIEITEDEVRNFIIK